MKNSNKISHVNITKLLRKTFERDKMVSLQNANAFLTFLSTLSWKVVTLSTLCSLEGAAARVKMIHNFGRYLLTQKNKKGVDYVIAYLKVSQLALSKFLSREKVGSLMELNPDFIFPRLCHGLPKIIGPRDRISLRANNRKVIIL